MFPLFLARSLFVGLLFSESLENMAGTTRLELATSAVTV
jgi:hypothetical protein